MVHEKQIQSVVIAFSVGPHSSNGAHGGTFTLRMLEAIGWREILNAAHAGGGRTSDCTESG